MKNFKDGNPKLPMTLTLSIDLNYSKANRYFLALLERWEPLLLLRKAVLGNMTMPSSFPPLHCLFR